MGGLRTWWRQLRGREYRAVELLGEQIEHARTAVAALREVVDGTRTPEEARTAVEDAEENGDRVRRDVVDELARAIVLPLDREDLFRLSRSVDDVLDNLRDFARELTLLEVDDPARFGPMLEAIDRGIALLADAIAELDDDDAARVADPALAAGRSENRVRRRYDEALAALLTGPVDVTMLRARELLRRLDVIGLRLEEAADALADGAVKRHR